jgi:hypothetical protein
MTTADQETESFTCPICLRTSYNPNDVREGYCGHCHDFTGPWKRGFDLPKERKDVPDLM